MASSYVEELVRIHYWNVQSFFSRVPENLALKKHFQTLETVLTEYQMSLSFICGEIRKQKTTEAINNCAALSVQLIKEEIYVSYVTIIYRIFVGHLLVEKQ